MSPARNVWYTGEFRWRLYCNASIVRVAGRAFGYVDENEFGFDKATQSAVIARAVILDAAKDLLAGPVTPGLLAAFVGEFTPPSGSLTGKWRWSRDTIRTFIAEHVQSTSGSIRAPRQPVAAMTSWLTDEAESDHRRMIDDQADAEANCGHYRPSAEVAVM